MSFNAPPDKTWAVVVGIEQYDVGGEWNKLDGPVHDCVRFVKWLRKWEVPSGQILTFLSPLPKNKLEAMAVEHEPASADNVLKAFADVLPEKTGEVLFIFWGGHGVVTEGKKRCLFYANATKSFKRNLDFTSLLDAMHTRSFSGFQKQIGFIDACANYSEDMGLTVAIPQGDAIPSHKDIDHDIRQSVLFASRAGEVAANNDVARTGEFSSLVLASLEQTDAFPGNLLSMNVNIKRHFDAMRTEGKLRQTPVHYSWNTIDFGGEEGELYSLPDSRDAQAVASQWNLSIKQLRAIYHAILKCPSMKDRKTRDGVVQSLDKEVRTAIVRRDDDPLTDVRSIVNASLIDNQAWDELLEVLRKFEPDKWSVELAMRYCDGLLRAASIWGWVKRVELPFQDLKRMYYDSAVDRQCAPAVDNLDDMLEALVTMTPRAGRVEPLIEFVERINRVLPAAGLDGWLQKQLDKPKREELKKRLDYAETQGKQTRPSLFILVKNKTDNDPNVEAWLSNGGDISHTFKDSNLSSEGVRQVVLELLNDFADVAVPPTLELFLPRELMCSAPELWKIDENDDFSMLGADYPIVIRWADRQTKADKRMKDRWRKRAEAILNRLNSGLPPSILHVKPGQPGHSVLELQRKIAYNPDCEDLIVLGIVPPTNPSATEIDFILGALIAGAPFLCWLRDIPPDWQQLDTELVNIMVNFREIPFQLHKARGQGGWALTTYLSLLWDDPGHLPYDARLLEPGQRTLKEIGDG
jgi:hypothetical protein